MKRTLFALYKIGLRFGIHVLPDHYYMEVPNILELERTRDIWAKKSELPGLVIDLDEQVKNLKTICIPYQKEYVGNKIYLEGLSQQFGGYGFIEAQALHAVIRYYKPKRIIEVGSGLSTYCMVKASKINESETGEHVSINSIEPFPSNRLINLKEINLIRQKVQTIDVDFYKKLQENDLLFIDSTHTVKPGGDVNYLILEVLPRIAPGVIVHFHDIYLPFDYQRRVLQSLEHWAETSLLRAFLINNEKAKIIFCQSLLHYERKEALTEVFPEYDPQSDLNGLCDSIYKPYESINKHFPSSIYLQLK